MSSDFATRAEVLKVDEALGLVFGWGLITGERVVKSAAEFSPYFDSQGDWIDDAGMLAATSDFMLKSRATTDLHAAKDGTVVFSFPLTAEIAKAFGIECSRTGWLVAIKPSAAVLEKFKTKQYTGFSIGGKRLAEEVIEA